MKKTFICEETMIITIPIGGLMAGQQGRLLPNKFQCVYKDSYKVFVVNGKPKPLGAAQIIGGVFILSLGLIFVQTDFIHIWFYIASSVLSVVSGLLTYAAGHFPNMHVAKLSFCLNIISFLWSLAVGFISALFLVISHNISFYKAIRGLILALLVCQTLMAIFLIYWLSKAVCRTSFNTLPIIVLKEGD